MTFLSFMYVAVGGAFGSMCRYGVMSIIGKFNPGEFPLGTFAVNILGAFLMGLLVAVIATLLPSRAKDLHLLLAVGVLGGFTTFSTFSLDVFLMFERGTIAPALLYVFGSVVLSVAALMGGMWCIKLFG
ncbi:MAG: fluoride efflux transporter CrcB [Pseudomonadota bacterium]|nr:fluoride efflux transporter CrcB [Pseudomonadota bacterium]MDE3038525.1 fluoride efflux transporter CrcB [Pseudomonadota bacterium]